MNEQTILVNKRFGEVLDAREYIQPNSYPVQQVANFLWAQGPSAHPYLERAWKFVVRDIAYPPGSHETQDWHRMVAYRQGIFRQPMIRHEAWDFWNYPSETLRDRIGDCDDKSILLVSLLRARTPEIRSYVTVGTLRGAGHMWVTILSGSEPVVLETTTDSPPLREEAPYEAWYRFTERDTIILPAFWAAHTGRR